MRTFIKVEEHVAPLSANTLGTSYIASWMDFDERVKITKYGKLILFRELMIFSLIKWMKLQKRNTLKQFIITSTLMDTFLKH